MSFRKRGSARRTVAAAGREDGLLRYVAVGAIVNAAGRFLCTLVVLAWAFGGPASAAEERIRILALGDSLTAGYGLPVDESFPARLEAALRADGLAVEVINAGVSGDTTAGGLSRLDWTLAAEPDYAIVALGANDGLRGLDPAASYRNLDAILAGLEARGVPALLAGMRAPPNLGREYGAAFNAIYPRLAEKHQIPLYPFLLDGVAAQAALNQPDGMHPNAQGVAVMVERILPHVLRLIGES